MITWNQALETGHPIVDQDHRRLIDMLNDLDAAVREGAGKEEMNRMLAFLSIYTREHFQREEGYMLKLRCPHHAENRQAHQELIQKLDGWTHQIQNSGISTSLLLAVYRETSQWVRQHIVRVDCKLRDCPKLATTPA